MGKAKKGISGIIGSIFVALLVLGILGAAVIWLIREDGLTVYVDYNEKRYNANSAQCSLGTFDNGIHSFTIGSYVGNVDEYTIDLSANPQADFEFFVDDKKYRWSSVDCSSWFTVNKTNSSFELVLLDNANITDMLQMCYQADVLYNSVLLDTTDYFILSVMSASVTINLSFGIAVGERKYLEGYEPSVSLLPTDVVF